MDILELEFLQETEIWRKRYHLSAMINPRWTNFLYQCDNVDPKILSMRIAIIYFFQQRDTISFLDKLSMKLRHNGSVEIFNFLEYVKPSFE